MTRTYKRKRWGSKDRRREAAVRLRAEGLSLREIAERLKVSHQTVKRDLETVTCAVTIFPAGGRNVTADVTADPLSQVITLAERRRA
jgi:transposase